MRRFLILLAIIFGFMLSYQTLKIMSQQKYSSDINVRQFKDKTLQIVSMDLFAEKNIYDTFRSRYSATLKFSLENDNLKYLTFNKPGDAVIYPSFAYNKLLSSKTITEIDEAKVPNIVNLMDNFTALTKEKYRNSGKLMAVPLAYVPYVVFLNPEMVKKSTSVRDFFRQDLKVAIADDYGAFLSLVKILAVPLDKGGVAALKKNRNKTNTLFFNPETPVDSIKHLMAFKPAVVIAPSYLISFMEREAGSLEVVLPDEGTYADLYLMSPLNTEQKELVHVFLNHMTDPLIQKNLTDVMNMPITNKVSLNTMAPVLYNMLKMNTPEYFSKKIMVLHSEKDFEKAVSLFKNFKEGF